MSASVLIVGGGVAGLEAALALASAGARAIVVERGPVVGGQLAAAMTADASAGGQVDDTPIPTLARLAEQPNVEILTLASLEGLEGEPGDFVATIREEARFVTDTCTRCNRCKGVCPVVVPNEYDAGLTFRKAIYTPLPETWPSPYAIDGESCLNRPPNYLPCQRCVEVCDDDSIHFDLPLARRHERRIDGVIVATGMEAPPGASLGELGYGVSPDVVTSRELQRLLESPGPTGGFVARPSDEESPGRVLLVLDGVSALATHLAAGQLRQLAEQGVDELGLLVLEQLPAGPERSELEAAAGEAGASLCFGALLGTEATEAGALAVKYADLTSGATVARELDMMVLSPDFAPPAGLTELAEVLRIELDAEGWVAVTEQAGAAIATSRPGVYAAGGATGPTRVAETVAGARAAAGVFAAPSAPAAQPAVAAPISEQALRQRIEGVLRALMELGGR